jgi:hypothetical protein
MILSESYRNRLRELSGIISESRKSEELGLNILDKAKIANPENVIRAFAEKDKSTNQKNIPVMAYLFSLGNADEKSIIEVLNNYDDLEVKKRIKPIQLSKAGITIGDKVFTDFIRFSEYIDGEKNRHTQGSTSKSNVANDFKSNKKPLWSGNGIDIYEGDNVGKCINYTMGGLGREEGYSFCIGQPGNTMYKSYRDTKDSSFYFIVDRNHFKEEADGGVNLDDPLHIVVFDNTSGGVELTDANNTTGNIAEYGGDVDAYVAYLKSKGVPVDKLVNKPKTEQERYEDELLGKPNDSLEWFMKLPIEYKSAYIGRGHRLTDEQFDYLIGR